MFDHFFPSDETRDAPSDPGGPDRMGSFYRAESPRPDTGSLLAEIGMPAHQIRSFIATRATTGAEG